MPVPDEILRLTEQFDRNRDAYRAGAYNETQVRREFLDPFFEALGWDVDNRQGYSERYKDVIHEDAIRVGAASRAPDYCFRIGGDRKFFVEAKKPSVNLHDDISPAFQLRRYAWSAKLPLSILTDFEELAVYDCRRRPDKSDKASTGRLLYFTYTDYAQRWEEIATIFSREAVLKGAFDQYAEAREGKRGTTEVDNAFLAEIEGWRDALARGFALRNPTLSQRALNVAVQVTIDRLIFLRICEDRGIETYGQLQALQNGPRVYLRLLDLFHRADDRYNSGLFHFRAEPSRAEPPDGVTPGLALDDKPLKEILKNLYYPDSPYEFSVLPADILGQVYERFLGKVIRLTAGHQAKVEEKPEVRKAGGVYYTPTYIVEYIVRNTVGKLLEGKRPEDVAGPDPEAPGRRRRKPALPAGLAVPPLRVVDPACGSGSFLIGAYQHLLDWYRDRYVEDDPQKCARGAAPRLYQGAGGEWRLTTSERKRILLAHIYGVDIDTQAVEVTKLSLLLKVLEGESDESLSSQMRLFQERALPDLSANIKCGNSLIGPDFYDAQQLTMLDDEERHRINVFDWQGEFPQVFTGDTPGFDAVIGNPPYGAHFGDQEKEYVRREFESYRYKYDSYVYFIERGIRLARLNGRVSFITPELWLRLENCEPLRRTVAHSAGLETLKVYGEDVFSAAVVNTVVVVFRRGIKLAALTVHYGAESWDVATSTWHSAPGLVIDYRIRPTEACLITKVRGGRTEPLSHFGEAIQGITPYDRYAGQDPGLIKRRAYHHQVMQDESCGKWLAGKDVGRYELGWSGEWLSYGPWLAAPRDPGFFKGKRLLFREVPGKAKRIQATLAEDTYYHGHSITPFKPNDDTPVRPEFLLGVANSRLISWYGGITLPNFGKEIFPKLNPQDIKMLPIRMMDLSDPADRERHDRMVAMVERMLELHRRLPEAGTAHEKTLLQREIDATDRQIDRLVYDLYGLTEDEIRIVEDAP